MKRIYLTLSISFFTLLGAHAQMDSLRSYYQQSIAAYEAQLYEEFLKYAKLANDIRPNHPTLAYNIASAYALNNQKEEAIQALESYIGMNAVNSFYEDKDFASLKGDPDFMDLKNLVEGKSKTITNSEIAFTIDQKEIHFESIASYGNGFFLGGVRSRTVYQYKDGKLEVYLTPKNYPGLFAVMGLGVDKENSVLWICTATLPEMESYTDSLQSKSTILALDLKDRSLIASYKFEKAVLGDLIVTEEGKVIASDGMSNRLFEGDTNGFEVLEDLSGEILNLQGLALDRERNRLYISDYITGIYWLDMKTRKVNKVNANGLYSGKGADGLLFQNNRLIAFKNGTSPKRTIEITLSKSGDVAESVSIIDQNLDGPGEPTQGVIVGDEVYYLSNSSWDAYEEGKYVPELSDQLKIRKFPVD